MRQTWHAEAKIHLNTTGKGVRHIGRITCSNGAKPRIKIDRVHPFLLFKFSKNHMNLDTGISCIIEFVKKINIVYSRSSTLPLYAPWKR